MKPESFSRALRQLRSVGVSVEREFVRIGDIERLAAFVGENESATIICPMTRGAKPCSPFGVDCAEATYTAAS